ncbi:MAG: thiamine phosphate synthase [Acidobacteria bacterium]|nr:thiamine phosphate synthase [Acidobacteriota bacterium]
MQLRLRELLAETPLYAILDTSVLTGRSSLEALEALLQAGVRVVQYRHKDAFRRTHLEECRELTRRAGERGCLLLVNDRADVADLCGAGGVHLGQDDLPAELARQLLGPDRCIGYSTHNLDQALAAEASSADYIAIGPVFATSTKIDPDPVVGLETVVLVRSATTKPLVAIGGITLENASAVLHAGADSVAVVRDLLTAPDIEARARQFVASLKI